MTDIRKPVSRRTVGPNYMGRRVVVSLLPGDVIGVREERTRRTYTAPVGKVWAAIAVALVVSPGKILGTVTEQLTRIPVGEQAMRMLGLIKSADTSPGELTAPEAAEAMMSIALKMPPGPLRDQIVAVISAAMKSDTLSGK